MSTCNDYKDSKPDISNNTVNKIILYVIVLIVVALIGSLIIK